MRCKSLESSPATLTGNAVSPSLGPEARVAAPSAVVQVHWARPAVPWEPRHVQGQGHAHQGCDSLGVQVQGCDSLGEDRETARSVAARGAGGCGGEQAEHCGGGFWASGVEPAGHFTGRHISLPICPNLQATGHQVNPWHTVDFGCDHVWVWVGQL